jgi:hypothetical protein
MNAPRPLTARIIRLSALYDLVVTAPFATPWSAALVEANLAHLHHSLHLTGAPPALDGLAMLFANLLGSIVVVWSLVRLRSPTLEHGLADTAGRVLFSASMALALARGGSTVIASFLALELLWALAQGVPAVVDLTRTPSPT